eukprot:gnl/TRDRNA2_/TRDRNA2_133091_c0_seq1.p1 gnl/TRDRNA2_/TRDRNA2_133091_c0~~gnl/TRDRNA2_/TRDRNA2_133091_c0_seq1.p1  ORF type:complete len:378 (+),score=36.75 gnl/TRDRNA2_/TRDRNA2_133091_c0_seq1:50-1135(+)
MVCAKTCRDRVLKVVDPVMANGPSGSEADRLDLIRSRCIVILGSERMQNKETPLLVEAIAWVLSKCFDGWNVAFLTGGCKGVQAKFASCCKPGSKIYNLVLTGSSANSDIGNDISVGSTLSEQIDVLSLVGSIYITFEGGRGVSREARGAVASGAHVLPIIRTGGASSGLFEFPNKLLIKPPYATPDQWWSISSSSASIDQCAISVLEMVSHLMGAILRKPPSEVHRTQQRQQATDEGPQVLPTLLQTHMRMARLQAMAEGEAKQAKRKEEEAQIRLRDAAKLRAVEAVYNQSSKHSPVPGIRFHRPDSIESIHMIDPQLPPEVHLSEKLGDMRNMQAIARTVPASSCQLFTYSSSLPPAV